MNRKPTEERFLDYLEGTLPPGEMEEIRAALETDTVLRNSFEEYRSVASAESSVRDEAHELLPGFDLKVMAELEGLEPGFVKRLIMHISRNQKIVFSSLATCAVLVLCIQLAWETPPEVISPQAVPVSIAVVEPVSPQATAAASQIQQPGPVIAEGHEEASAPAAPPEPALRELDSVSDTSSKKTSPDASRQGPVVAKEMGAEGARAEIAGGKDRQLAHDLSRVHAERERSGLNTASGSISRGGYSLGLPAEEAKTKALAQSADSRGYQPPEAALGGIVFDEMPSTARIMPPHPPAQPYIQSGEQYIHYGENPRISTRDEAVSTFSLDVDTGSYTNVRRFLMSGKLPPADAVRIEEMINYFPYNYPVQYGKPFTVSYEIAPSPLEPDRFLLKLGVKTRDAREERSRKNLVFLIDVSGSMADANKLELVKPSLKLLVEKLDPADRIAIVTYAGNAGVALDSTEIRERQRILSAIDGLHAGGGTNGNAGIQMAYDIARRNSISGGVNRVILATDGDFNVGVTSFESLMQMIQEKRRSGITLTTVGVGAGNLKEGQLEQLANRGNGNYFYLDSFKEARKVFENELAATTEIVAKDVKLQVEFNPRHVAQYRLLGYDNRKLANQDFHNDQVDAGEVGTGQTVTALYELVLADSPLAGSLTSGLRYQKNAEKPFEIKDEFNSELAFLKIRYKQPEAESSKLINYPLDSSQIRRSVEAASDDFRFAAAVSAFGHLLRKSQFAGSYSYQQVVALAEKTLGSDPNGYRREFVEIVKNAAAAASAPGIGEF